MRRNSGQSPTQPVIRSSVHPAGRRQLRGTDSLNGVELLYHCYFRNRDSRRKLINYEPVFSQFSCFNSGQILASYWSVSPVDVLRETSSDRSRGRPILFRSNTASLPSQLAASPHADNMSELHLGAEVVLMYKPYSRNGFKFAKLPGTRGLEDADDFIQGREELTIAERTTIPYEVWLPGAKRPSEMFIFAAVKKCKDCNSNQIKIPVTDRILSHCSGSHMGSLPPTERRPTRGVPGEPPLYVAHGGLPAHLHHVRATRHRERRLLAARRSGFV